MKSLYHLAMRQHMDNSEKKIQEILDMLPDGDPLRERFVKMLRKTAGQVTLRQAKDTDWDFSDEKAAELFARDDTLVLRPIRAQDENFFCALRKRSSLHYRSAYYAQAKHRRELYENEVFLPQTFYCIIERAADRTPMGYIGIKDTAVEPWEVAIELGPTHVNQGFGPRSLRLFLNKLHSLTGKAEILARVESDNIPSQKCFEKLGAELVRARPISVINTPEELAQFEAAHLDRIDANLEALAKRLDIPSQTLLSHTLDYRLPLPLEFA